MSTLLGDPGTMLQDTPLGKSMCRVTDAVQTYLQLDDTSIEGEEVAIASTLFIQKVLDLLVELEVTATI